MYKAGIIVVGKTAIVFNIFIIALLSNQQRSVSFDFSIFESNLIYLSILLSDNLKELLVMILSFQVFV